MEALRPEHLQYDILSRLDWTSLARAAAVCRLWRSMVITQLITYARPAPSTRVRDMHAAQASDIDAQPVWNTNVARCTRASKKSTAFNGLVVRLCLSTASQGPVSSYLQQSAYSNIALM